jgi:hypothetical protein
LRIVEIRKSGNSFMSSLSSIRFQGQSNKINLNQPTFKAGTAENVVDMASQAIEKVKTPPDENVIKGAIGAVITVIGLFLAKNATKMKNFIDKNSQSSNKFVKAISIAAGAILSILSVVGASSLFQQKTSQIKDGAPETAGGEANGSPLNVVS